MYCKILDEYIYIYIKEKSFEYWPHTFHSRAEPAKRVNLTHPVQEMNYLTTKTDVTKYSTESHKLM